MDAKFFTICSFLLVSYATDNSAEKLKLLHVLSVNKFYVPDYNYSSNVFEAPKKLTYQYFYQNSADIPNSVKLSLFKLGEFLRKNYDYFLGSLYMDEAIKMQTTEFPVSIMAGELINAGLWPPVDSQIWNNDLLWQPIPFAYQQAEKDTILLGTECPNFKAELKKVLNNYNVTAEHKKILDLINTEGQIKVNNSIDASLFYLALENSLELNQTLPEWLKKIYPSESFLEIALAAYDLLSETNIQKRLNGGAFLRSVITDWKNYMNKSLSDDRKINIYSGDDRNFAGIMKNLNISLYQLPNPGSALIFELHEDSSRYVVKILYYNSTTDVDAFIPLRLNDCDSPCPIDKFISLVANVLPVNDLSLCSSANVFTIFNFLIIVLFIVPVNYVSLII